MGSVLWQLNDCWPVTSWAVVDGASRLKPAWYALRRAYAPRLLAFRGSSLVAVNDTDTPWESSVVLRRLSFDGAELSAAAVALSVAPRSVSWHPVPGDVGDAAAEVLVAEVDGLRATRLFAEDTAVAYDPSAVTATAVPDGEGWAVTVTASSFARDIAVLADRVAPDATVDDMLITLLPGESRTFRVRTRHAVTAGALTAPDVIRSANSLAAVARAR
jgi:beta-mannosidase